MSAQSPNFAFLATTATQLAALGAQAERYFVDDAVVCLFKLRQFGEVMAQLVAAKAGLWTSPEEPQNDLLRRLRDRRLLAPDVADQFHRLRKAGNEAVHDGQADRRVALLCLTTAHTLAVWFKRTVTGDRSFSSGPFVPPAAPPDPTKELRAELDRLRTELDESRSAAARHEAVLREEAERRLGAEERAARAEQERAELAALAAATDNDLARLRTELEALQSAAQAQGPAATEAVIERAQAAVDEAERETRRRIDAKLVRAGWEADSERLTHAAGARPQRGRNRAIAEWPTASGPADYVLFIGLTPVAVVEAKRQRTDVQAALDQAARYSRDRSAEDGETAPEGGPWGAFRIPFLFATNGRRFHRQFKTGSGIWFRDARRPTNLARPLAEWPSPDGLRTLLERDPTVADAALAATAVDFAFGPRDYQVKAIRAAEGTIAAGARELLLAMATGTGKTKNAIGLMHRLLESGRFRRILFLVDRNPLAKQAIRAFNETRITAAQTFADVHAIAEPQATAPDTGTKVQVATVQAMVRRILYPADGAAPPPADQFDCIVVDECHRGYLLDREMGEEELRYRDLTDYVSKYRQVLDHFDAVRIGLTATPALHTVDIFGPPVFEFRYEDGVQEGVLIDHDTPLRIDTLLSRQGIGWEAGEDVEFFDPATGELRPETLDDEMNFEVEDFNRKVLTENFNRAVAAELVKHIPPDTPAKTLVFAVNDRHADTLVAALKEAYQQAHGAIDDALVRKITRAAPDADDLITHYRNEALPKVAVTVELLTTGIDIPAIANLVFVRRVNSRILYEQMIGRATRPCDAFPKPTFRIFDAVGLYAAMQKVTAMKPVVTDPNVTFATLADELIALYGLAPPPPGRHDTPGFGEERQEPFAGPPPANVDEGRARYLLGQLIGKLQRRRRVLTGAALDRFMTLYPDGPASFAIRLRDLEPEEAAALLARHRALVDLLDGRGGSAGQPLPVSTDPDAPMGVRPTYGPGIERPEDYLGAFSRFVSDNLNAIPALAVAVQRPRDLTRAQLKELRRLLEEHHFRERDLETAWRQASNAEIAAKIIGFIRKAAIGDPLVPYDQRVDAALGRILARREWTEEQRRWLERIGTQLKKEVVVDRAALDAEPFQAQGGFRAVNGVFGGRVEEVLAELGDEIWARVGT